MTGEQKLFTAWMTSTDRVDHAVSDEEFAANRPEPEAMCGAVIMLASMETPPGPRCARCTAFLAARESLRGLEQRLDPHRHRRPSWLGRLLHPNTSTPVVPGPRALARDGRLQAPVDTAGSPAAVSTGLPKGAGA
ncbi:hypothetical protein [Kutzneria buriramensis]|uniref:Uncharacterized protein n=1 Tax=Kutzneria buriramensis TaxID=1045776 RepID=A0A3E0GT72_9PSEU|nr:hypothetical protein [Kutzneria buriramensis]REH25983.1 hypothetical protein BCF44_13522 [Kutzneria buriramensis]